MYNELTKNDIKKMEEEIEHRIHVVRKEALEDVKTARAHGDLSENFEYHAAKREKNKNESRIRYLERMLKTAVVVENGAEDGKIGLNYSVTVAFDDGEEETYRIVTSIRGNSLANRISMESPLGKALLGHKAGDKVEVHVNPETSYFLTILNVDGSDMEENEEIRKF